MRLLLVEDDAMIGRSLDRALTQAGMAVDWVRMRADCAAALAASPYDLLLLDLGLPDGDGLDLLATMRKQYSETPVVIITARDDVATRIVGLDSGADDYVVKPFDFDELNARIRHRILGDTPHRAYAGRRRTWACSSCRGARACAGRRASAARL